MCKMINRIFEVALKWLYHYNYYYEGMMIVYEYGA
jgi:hypothetical protein